MIEDRSNDVARRCSTCAYDWPDTQEYATCPSCLEETDRCRDQGPMDSDEAASLKAHFDFERFYEDWDASHPPERLHGVD